LLYFICSLGCVVDKRAAVINQTFPADKVSDVKILSISLDFDQSSHCMYESHAEKYLASIYKEGHIQPKTRLD
jgi:hypothetical protein